MKPLTKPKNSLNSCNEIKDNRIQLINRKTVKITILGAGRWGSAMSIYLSNLGPQIKICCHSLKTLEFIQKNDCSPYLKDFAFSNQIQATIDYQAATKDAELIILAVPVPFLRKIMVEIQTIKETAIFVAINKGIEEDSLKTVPQIVKEFFPLHSYAQLGGPCFPEGLISNSNPAAETLACEDEKLGFELQALFHSDWFRVYRSTDVEGVALLGAVKNVFAIGAGIVTGLGFSEESISVLITRGLAEMRRISKIYGIQQETLYGLSGLGDLVLTSYSQANSHNKNFGIQIGRGTSVEETTRLQENAIAEGFFTTRALWILGKKHQIDLPLINAIYQVLYEEKPVKECLIDLMSRPLKSED